MNTEEYVDLFDPIIKGDYKDYPYDNVEYVNYTKLNKSRQNRWLKRGLLLEECIQQIKKINTIQSWIVITEPWCGDAAHNIPFILKLAEYNPLIKIEFILRDTPPLIIEDYLTNGGKSIPKLIVRNQANEDIFTWGPRPAACQKLMLENKERGLSAEEQKIKIQEWYNEDAGVSIQQELLELMLNN